MTEAEYIGSELHAADELRIKHEKRIAELEAALDRIRRVHPDMTKPASAAFFECVAIADRALQEPERK